MESISWFQQIKLQTTLLLFDGYITLTSQKKLGGTKAYKQTSAEGKSVINHHIFKKATRFGVDVDEDLGRLSTFYWLHKLHKQPYKSRFIANSSSCTPTELSKLLTSCLHPLNPSYYRNPDFGDRGNYTRHVQ